MKNKTIFEELGFQYFGPTDGHDIEQLIKIFENLRDIANYKPVIIHTVTEKGKGYEPAERDSNKLHGIENQVSKKYSDVFGKKIVELAEKDDKIVCITAAMKSGCGLNEFAAKFPDRFFDVGIAESHAVTFAAGLAKEGLKPFVAIYSSFLQRAFDQIYHDVVLQNLPVRFIIDKAGFPGQDGKTHSGIYDIAMLQNFDNLYIFAPSSENELKQMLDFASNHDSTPLAIRYPKAEVYKDNSNPEFNTNFKQILQGTGCCIFFSGSLLQNIAEAIKISKTNPTVINIRKVKPIDIDSFIKISENHSKIIVADEGVFGGLSSSVVEGLIENQRQDVLQKIQFLCSSKKPVSSESRTEQINKSDISINNIAKCLRL